MDDSERRTEERALLYRAFFGGVFLGILVALAMQPNKASTSAHFDEHVACVERGGVFVQHQNLTRCVIPKAPS